MNFRECSSTFSIHICMRYFIYKDNANFNKYQTFSVKMDVFRIQGTLSLKNSIILYLKWGILRLRHSRGMKFVEVLSKTLFAEVQKLFYTILHNACLKETSYNIKNKTYYKYSLMFFLLFN